jgi:hypothetical protein
MIKTCFETAIDKYQTVQDKGLKWDLIKMEMRLSTSYFCKTKAREHRYTIKKTILEVDKLEKEINEHPSDENIRKYHEGKKSIENYNNEKASGAQLRSKTNWIEYGERNTKYFLNLEKRNYQMKCITKLIDDTKTEINEPDKILEYEEEFYKNLYSPKNEVDPTKMKKAGLHFKDETLPKISKDDSSMCEGNITIGEIGEALKGLLNGKSPGSDGFTADFYKFFWPTIRPAVYESLLYAKGKGNLSIDQRRGIINLIPKKDKDPRELKNWRPISLLNTDYKIITKLLANRIKKYCRL